MNRSPGQTRPGLCAGADAPVSPTPPQWIEGPTSGGTLVGGSRPGQLNGFEPVRRGADNGEAAFCLEQLLQPLAIHGVIVG